MNLKIFRETGDIMAIYKSGEELMKEVRETKGFGDAVSFWILGQAGILLKGKEEDGLICIDPYLTSSIEESNPETEFKRAFPPVLNPAMLQDLDGVLVTHGHDDHLDLSTIKEITRVSDSQFGIPAPLVTFVQEHLKNKDIYSAKDGEVFKIKGFKVTPIPAAHTEYEKDSSGNHLFLGYLI